jgi:hypothetical protein
VSVLALGAPLYIAFTAILLFAAAVVVMYTFSLVRHAKTLAKDAARAGERLNDAAEAIEAQMKAISDRASTITGETKRLPSRRRRGV